jgi:hypothetical protein
MKGLESLPTESSEGPNASRGNIGYDYQNLENIYNYFSIMIVKQSKYPLLCLPKFTVKYGKYFLRAGIVYDTVSCQYWLSPKIKSAIQKCSKKRFILCSLQLLTTSISHCNMILIDTKKKTIERFEPMGWTLGYTKDVDEFLKHVVREKFGLSKYKYLPPEELSEKIGIQVKGDSYNGMCVTISMLYLHLRVKNPDTKAKRIVRNLTSLPLKQLKTIILRYAKYIEKTLKLESKYVNSVK